MGAVQSYLNSVQNQNPRAARLLGASGGDLPHALNLTPHDIEMKQQEEADKKAAEQAAADAAAVRGAPVTRGVSLRQQYEAQQRDAAGAVGTNAADVAGSSLFKGAKRKGAVRSLFGY